MKMNSFKKKIMASLLAVSLVVGMAVPAMAAPTTGDTTAANTVTVKVDGAATAGKTVTLQEGTETAIAASSESAGVYTFDSGVLASTVAYKVLVGGDDTGLTYTPAQAGDNFDVEYFTVTFVATDVGTASGSSVTATAGGDSITSGDAVLKGKEVVITATGASAGSYTYAWTGTGANNETTAALTISSLASKVDVSCAVTGATTSSLVILANGSLGTAGDTKITALTANKKYKITHGGAAYAVKADGTLDTSFTDYASTAELTGTEITGLTNGTTYKVEQVTAPAPTVSVTGSSFSVANTGETKAITGNVSGIVSGATDVTWTITKGTDTNNILTIPQTATGTLSNNASFAFGDFVIVANAADESAKTAIAKITFTDGADYTSLPTEITLTFNLAAGETTATDTEITATAVTIGTTAPVVDTALDTTAAPAITNATAVAVVWKDGSDAVTGNAGGTKTYTSTYVYTPDAGYKFASGWGESNFTVTNIGTGSKVATVSGDGKTLTVVVTWPATGASTTPAATIGNVDVAGTKDTAITAKDVVITLQNDGFKAIALDANLASWFTNLPAGLTAKAKAAVDANATTVTIKIEGTPTVALSAPMTVVIPAAALTGNANITATANAAAKWSIANPTRPTPPTVYTPSYGGGSSNSTPTTTPSNDLSTIISNTDVSANTPKGTEVEVPSSISDPTFDTREIAVNAPEAKAFVDTAASSGFAFAKVFQMNLFDGTTKVTKVEDGKVKIALPFEGKAGYEYMVLRYETNGGITAMPALYKDGQITFTTNHFSLYAIAVKSADKNLFANTTVKPGTPDSGTTSVPQTSTCGLVKLF